MLKNIIVIGLLINCKIVIITSATIKPQNATNFIKPFTMNSTEWEFENMEGVNFKKSQNSNSTESSEYEIMIEANENPFENKMFKLQAESLIKDDFDRKLMNIFDIDLEPTAAAPKKIEEFNSAEMAEGRKLSLSRRTNFETRLNCHCIIRNRCAKKKNSCLRNKRSEIQEKI